MRGHVMHYHVDTSGRLAYMLPFVVMAGKRKFRPVVLSSAAKKAKNPMAYLEQPHGLF